MLPVNKETWDKYVAGTIGDNQFSDAYIIPDVKKNIDQKAYGLILFSVAVAKHPEKEDRPPDYWKNLGNYLEQAIVYHINTYLKTLFKSEKSIVPVLFQNMDISFQRFFKDNLMSVEGISRDGARIIAFEVAND